MSEQAPKPGIRFVIEGLDGTGKSEAVKRTLWQFAKNGYETLQIDEPGSPVDQNGKELLLVSSELRKLVKDGESYESNPYADLGMMNTSRFASYKLITKPFVAAGGVAGQARDWRSSLAFQGHSAGLGIETVDAMCRDFMGDETYFEPDFTTILQLDDDKERLRRIENRGILETLDKFESRGQEAQDLTKDGYRIAAEQYGIDVTHIEAKQSREEVAEIVLAKILGATGLYIIRHDWEEYNEEQARKAAVIAASS